PGLVGLTHFHSSTTSESASLMSLRILLRVSPRQSPSSAILFEMSSDGDWPWLASDLFMVSSWKLQISFIHSKTLRERGNVASNIQYAPGASSASPILSPMGLSHSGCQACGEVA